MAAMTTVLTEFADNGNSRTYTTSGHTAVLPKLVIQKRKVASSAEGSSSITVSVVHGTEDASGNPLASRVAADVSFRFPLNGASADVAAVLAVLKDIVAGDEFANSVSTQEWLS